MISCFLSNKFVVVVAVVLVVVVVVHRCDVEFHGPSMILKEKAEAEAGSTGRGPWVLDVDEILRSWDLPK